MNCKRPIWKYIIVKRDNKIIHIYTLDEKERLIEKLKRQTPRDMDNEMLKIQKLKDQENNENKDGQNQNQNEIRNNPPPLANNNPLLANSNIQSTDNSPFPLSIEAASTNCIFDYSENENMSIVGDDDYSLFSNYNDTDDDSFDLNYFGL